MNASVLVPLKNVAQLAEVMPYVDSVAEAGTKVVFLLRTRASNWPRMQAQLTAMETGHFTSLSVSDVTWRDRMKQEKRNAEEKLAGRNLFRSRNICTEVTIYQGSLKKALARFAGNGSPVIVVTPTRRLFPTARIVRSALSAIGISKPESLPPVLLHHSNQTMRG